MFYETRVTLHRPHSGDTPLGVTKVVVEAETDADGARKALFTARDDVLRDLGGPWLDDYVEKIDAEIIGSDGGASVTWRQPYTEGWDIHEGGM